MLTTQWATTGAGPTRAATLDSLLPPVLPQAYRTAYSLTRNRPDAEDLVQQAALQAARGFGTFQPGTNFKAWFLRILTNEFYSSCRRARRADEVSLGQFDDPGTASLVLGGEDMADLSTDPLGEIETDEILEALGDLQPEYRSVAVLYFVDDLSYQAIARILQVPVGTVRSRLHRARAFLKKRLARFAVEQGFGG